MNMFRSLAIGLIMAAASAGAVGVWQIETVDQAGVGKFSSMRIDKEGNIHVVYAAADGEDSVKYGFWDRPLKRWFLMTIDKHGSFCSLTLDSEQHPHISYVDSGSMPGAKLHYARWDGATWKTESVPLNAEIVAYYSSIALDALGRASISFYEYTGPGGSGFRVRMRVVRFNGKYWEVTTVDGDNQSGKFNALAIDPQGHTHLAYANVNGMTAGMRYAYWDGVSWKAEVLEGLPATRAYLGYSACIALDKDGDPHVSYSHYDSPLYVKYGVRKGGHWQIQVVDELSGVGYPDRNSIFVYDPGQPYISYFDAGQGTLRLAHRVGQKWVAETVDSGGVGFNSSVQIDRGVIWISYADEGHNGFKVAHRALGPGDSAVIAAGSVQTSQREK